jgi:hypothetical protein
MAARAQLEQMRRALPPGVMTMPGHPATPQQQEPPQPGQGQYL